MGPSKISLFGKICALHSRVTSNAHTLRLILHHDVINNRVHSSWWQHFITYYKSPGCVVMIYHTAL